MKKKLLLGLGLLLGLASSQRLLADDWYFNGNAAPTGWTDDGTKKQVNAFTPSGDGTFFWIGKLKTGGEGFKIGHNTSGFSGWGDVHPSTAGFAIADATDTYTEGGGSDTKWTVAADGIYKLTLNTNNQTLTCETYTPTINPNASGVYEISTAAQLFEFAELVSHDAIDASASAVLTADIDYTAYSGYSVIGRSQDKAYAGTFDGQGHKVTINFTDVYGRTGLFGYCYHPTIKNLWVDGSITMSSHNCAGGIGGRCDGDGTTLDGLMSTVTINDEQSGDGTIGGLFANIENNSVVIKNCAFMGIVNAPSRDGNGGLVGWCGSGNNITFQNCLVAPVSITWNGGATIGRNTPTISNCYATSAVPSNSFSYNNSVTVTTSTDEQLTSGELAYLLNESVSGAEHWYQTLGTDAKPVPNSNSSKVYANGEFYCSGVSKGTITYGNTDANVTDPHTFGDNGLCSACQKVGQEPALSEGVYQIANIGNLVWFSAAVNAGQPALNGTLTADIAQGDVSALNPIGCTEYPYVGTFDGQTHSVTLNMNNSTLNNQGLFGVVTDGVDIENVIVKGSVTGNNYVGGIAGATNGGSSNAKKTKVINCGNEADITAAGANAGGIIGVNMSGSASFHFENVYNAGTIRSGREGGAMSGWSGGGWSYFKNCLNIGKVYNGDTQSSDFTRHGGTSINNCYYSEESGTSAQNAATSVTAAQLASGEVAYKLGDAFYQTIGTDANPVLATSSAKIYYVGDAGYATMYDAANDWKLNGDATAFIGKINTTGYLHLGEIADIPAGTAVILKGSYYNKLAATATASTDGNILQGTTADTDASDKYILANGGNGIGFYPASGTIAAGKAYIPASAISGGVKAVLFDDEDATGIQNLTPATTGEGVIYNLAGQRISKMQKGINIVNGKKILF